MEKAAFHRNLLQQLQGIAADEAVAAWLIGSYTAGVVHVLSLLRCNSLDPFSSTESSILHSLLPGGRGIHPVGVLLRRPNGDRVDTLEDIEQRARKTLNNEFPDVVETGAAPVVVVLPCDDSSSGWEYHLPSGLKGFVGAEISDGLSWAEHHAMIRCRATVSVPSTPSSRHPMLCNDHPKELHLVFDVSGYGLVKPTADSEALSIADLIARQDKTFLGTPVIEVDLLQMQPEGDGCPVVSWKQMEASTPPRHSLRLDAVCYCPRSDKVSVALAVLVKAMRAQAERMSRNCVVSKSPQTFAAFHFRPGTFPHCLTVTYNVSQPFDETTRALQDRRRELHQRCVIPCDRPTFVTDGHVFSPPRTTTTGGVGGPRLSDVHVDVQPPSLPGSPYLVQGSYDYYHYMQDKFDDKGWGCAYRSLQTVFSWFIHQGYTTKCVPTHREIQQILANIDKPASFVGSKEWIGAVEESWVLDTVLGVQCRIVNVMSGDELAQKGRELAAHFSEQGTPIMMGGGVLAYTLLGVHWDPQTGETRFLILDPHYTGREDASVVRDKGWIAWRSADIFVKGAHYNLCLPQRPIVF
eukprot:Rmarinus@m.28395